jgi:CPA1 family monovalent cation:H+ antiporter
MADFETVIFILAILIGFSAIADNIKLPYLILLVGTGLLIGFVPFLPNMALDFKCGASHFSSHTLVRCRLQNSLAGVHLIHPSDHHVSGYAGIFQSNGGCRSRLLLDLWLSWPLAFVLGAIVSPGCRSRQ